MYAAVSCMKGQVGSFFIFSTIPDSMASCMYGVYLERPAKLYAFGYDFKSIGGNAV
jgi:hypothetical protein